MLVWYYDNEVWISWWIRDILHQMKMNVRSLDKKFGCCMMAFREDDFGSCSHPLGIIF